MSVARTSASAISSHSPQGFHVCVSITSPKTPMGHILLLT